MENRGNRNPPLANRKADRQRRGETKLAQTGNAQAKKLALVAVLLAVLIGALLTQPESETAESLEDVVQHSIVSLKNSQTPVQEPSLPEELLSVTEFASVDLDLARASSAFALENRLVPTQSTIVPSKVNAIYGSSDRRSAVIAKQVIRQGEKMNDGRTVIEINDAGAVIQP